MTDAIDQPNFRSPAALVRRAQDAARLLFAQSPLNLLVLTPDLRIVDANAARLAAVGRSSAELTGVDLFTAFPDSPHDPDATGTHNLAASLTRVLTTAGADTMPVQRYDIRPDDGPWEVRYWKPHNWAVVEAGAVVALVHHVEDVTALMLDLPGRTAPTPPSPFTDLSARADAALAASRRLVEQVRRNTATAQRDLQSRLRR